MSVCCFCVPTPITQQKFKRIILYKRLSELSHSQNNSNKTWMSEKNQKKTEKLPIAMKRTILFSPVCLSVLSLGWYMVQLCELGMTSEIPGHVDLANTNLEELVSAFKSYFICTHLRRKATYCNKFVPCLQSPMLHYATITCHYWDRQKMCLQLQNPLVLTQFLLWMVITQWDYAETENF